jgi:hypothetical protein
MVTHSNNEKKKNSDFFLAWMTGFSGGHVTPENFMFAWWLLI